jgi:hypothetical protein
VTVDGEFVVRERCFVAINIDRVAGAVQMAATRVFVKPRRCAKEPKHSIQLPSLYL